ncbi:MAG TPA: hypothetical protein VE175_00200 [Woeseiaceae bacterium]|jgi:hypothetical protein|nr:hypothetical protein [Woeseiaceae bacterium]
MDDTTRPDGIEHRHIHEAHGTRLHAWPTGLAILALAIAVFGVFGRRDTVTAEGDRVRLSVEGPSRIRSGELFEMLFTIETDREIRDAVLSVGPEIWHEVTINTVIPEPTEESFSDGSFEFHFGALRPGSRLLVKVDAQINPVYPPGNNEAVVALIDGPATLVALDYSMRVYP